MLPARLPGDDIMIWLYLQAACFFPQLNYWHSSPGGDTIVEGLAFTFENRHLAQSPHFGPFSLGPQPQQSFMQRDRQGGTSPFLRCCWHSKLQHFHFISCVINFHCHASSFRTTISACWPEDLLRLARSRWQSHFWRCTGFRSEFGPTITRKVRSGQATSRERIYPPTSGSCKWKERYRYSHSVWSHVLVVFTLFWCMFYCSFILYVLMFYCSFKYLFLRFSFL